MFLFGGELHHEYVKWVCAWNLTVLDLSRYDCN
jgi:hypothetical protein